MTCVEIISNIAIGQKLLYGLIGAILSVGTCRNKGNDTLTGQITGFDIVLNELRSGGIPHGKADKNNIICRKISDCGFGLG